MEITIAIIKENDFKFDKDLYYDNKTLLENDISKLIELKTISHEIMMETIVLSIGLTHDTLGNSPIFHETSENIYQLCYVGNDEIINKTLPKNSICSYLTGENVDTTTVIINSHIGLNKTYEPDSITVNDIVNILYSKFIHKGIHLSYNNSPIEFNYFDHPIEYYNIKNEEDFNLYKAHEFTFMGIELCMIIETNPTNNINKKATRLLGTHKINGNVLLIVKSSNEFLDLSLDLYNQMNDLAFGPLHLRELKDDEKTEDTSIALNKFSVLKNRHNLLLNKCNSCNVIFTDVPLICSGCYRVKYHMIECRANDWDDHKKECLYNKDYLNA